jgi:hypothetical protein
MVMTASTRRDGAYCYSNPNASTYGSNGQGGSTYTGPNGAQTKKWSCSKIDGTSLSADGSMTFEGKELQG